MLYFVIMVVLALALLIAIPVAAFGPEGNSSGPSYNRSPNLKRIGKVAIGVIVALGLIATGLFSFTKVEARSVGIVTALGQYDGTLGSGVHLTAPWASVESFPTTVQILDLDGATENGGKESVAVAYKGGGDGNVNVTVRWRLDGTDNESAKELWRSYRTFDNVSDQLVKNNVRASVKSIVGKYTPAEARDGNNLRPIESAVKEDLNAQFTNVGVSIDSINVVRVDLGKQAQQAVNRIVEATANEERAQSEYRRAVTDSKTAKLRESEGALTPEALTRYCLEVANAWNVEANGPLPATFNCGMGDKASVLVQSGK